MKATLLIAAAPLTSPLQSPTQALTQGQGAQVSLFNVLINTIRPSTIQRFVKSG